MTKSEIQLLVEMAKKVRKNAYSPYFKIYVGAALLAHDGTIHVGCNVENAAYPHCMCAERVAIFKAVSEGETEFEVLAVATPNGGSPCGGCRQVMAEFSLETTILIADGEGRLAKEATVEELLPGAFTPKDLER